MIYTKAKRDDSNGTSLMGYVKCSYQHLIKRLGQPHLNCKVDLLDSKIDVEWILKFKDGTVSTLYNYKNGPNYLGSDGTQVEQMTIWHVGGFTDKSLFKIAKALKVESSNNKFELENQNKSKLKTFRFTRTQTVVDYQTIEALTEDEAESKLELENWKDEEILSCNTESDHSF